MTREVSRSLYSVLVIDPDREFLEFLHEASASSPYTPVLAASLTEAERALKDSSQHFTAVFINPMISPKAGVTLIRRIHEERPGVPLFLIFSGNRPFTDRE